MENPNLKPRMKNRFTFVNIEVNKQTEKTVNLKLLQVLAFAPPGSVAYGTVEKVGPNYLAKVLISSNFRAFSAYATASHLERAANQALEKITDQVFKWRFGGSRGGPHSLAHLPLTASLA